MGNKRENNWARCNDAIVIVPDKKIKKLPDEPKVKAKAKASDALVSAQVPPSGCLNLSTSAALSKDDVKVAVGKEDRGVDDGYAGFIFSAQVPPAGCLKASTSAAPSKDGVKVAVGKEDRGVDDGYAGFIFMCNDKTKPECYRYGVFGLPAGNKEVVEKIKPGAKLFLFDFQLKLLYGIYEASTVGKLNWEPAAFGGYFPAQVRFKIYKDCLPLPESSFKNAIEHNYRGSKFLPELSSQQVRNLSSLYRTFYPAPSEPVPCVAPQPWSTMNSQSKSSVRIPTDKDWDVSPQPWLSMKNHLRPSVGLPTHEDPYDLARFALQPWLTHPIEHRELSSQHRLYRASATIDPVDVGHQYMQAPRERHYSPGSRGHYLADDYANMPGSFLRYERPPTITEDEHLRSPLRRENFGGYYNPYTMYTASSHPISMEQSHSSPSRRAASFDRNTITEDEHLQYPLRRENFGGYYNSYTMYTASSHSMGMEQSHSSPSRRAASFDRNMPVSSYYTFEGAARINR